MKQVNEGLRANDLRNLVSDVISVDEFNSKIDESAIVVGFYVQDRTAAHDLNRFIQKSAVDLLDTDVSPAPDQRGFYVVFVELPLNMKLGENVYGICKDISALVDITNWRMRVRTMKNIVPVDVNTLNEFVQTQLKDKLHEFFFDSDLTALSLNEGVLNVTGAGKNMQFSLVDFGPVTRLFETHNLKDCGVSMNRDNLSESKNIQLALGGAYQVNDLGDVVAVQNCNSSEILLVRYAL